VKRRSHGEKHAPLCAFSLVQLLARRREALALCDELGWKRSRLYDALELMSKGDSAVVLNAWQAVPRPAHAVPLDVDRDAAFVRELLDAERQARALNAAGPDLFQAGRRGEDAAGVGLACRPVERTVEAIEARHAGTRPREGRRSKP
jgi:hypothetical protein